MPALSFIQIKNLRYSSKETYFGNYLKCAKYGYFSNRPFFKHEVGLCLAFIIFISRLCVYPCANKS